jgi:DNA invertase Pin-like site-specific DNA recombinase
MAGSKRVQRRLDRNKVNAERQAVAATKAVGYLRVSTEEQAQHGFGLEAQERAVRAFAESQGYELVDIHADAGVSGATRPGDRQGFRRAIELAGGGAFSVLLVYKFDRLARDIRHAVTTVAELGELHGVVLRSVTEPIDTSSPMGKTLFAILAGMAENERHAITERTLGGRVMKAGKGGLACGTAPYGYKLTEDGLKVVPQEAGVVRRIFALRAAGGTLQWIADDLNATSIPSPKGSTWRPGTVAYILDNPKYRGALEWLFGETHVLKEGTHAAIV